MGDAELPFRAGSSFSSSSRSSIDVATPTGTIDGSTLHSSTSQKLEHMETPPYPGNTYAIRDRNSGRLITLVNGMLRLENCVGEQGGWHWKCEEKQGWLGFRSPVAGWYMGHDCKGNFVACVSHHKPHEYFCARRHPQGGYFLLMKEAGNGVELKKMAIGEDPGKLVMSSEQGVL
ncbi:hypothetical protein F4818DRAFT_301706 [Hypoxylon cercidicola]|nr:hypothetical protein F4818DRAFT_301706 [Hypoxylon cercidicola]